MSATDKRLCDTCMNDKCPYGGKGPVIDREPTEMCEHYESMSGSDKLRRLLDERGVKHRDYDHSDERVTEWANGGRRDVRYEEWNSGTVRLDASNITPEQAIAVTLGTETCHMIYNELADISRCESCGWRANGKPTNFCPNCGRRVVDE